MCLITADGSDNQKIKLEGLPGYVTIPPSWHFISTNGLHTQTAPAPVDVQEQEDEKQEEEIDEDRKIENEEKTVCRQRSLEPLPAST